MLRGQRHEFPRPLIFGFLDRSRYFFIQVAPQPHEAEWTPFRTPYFSENLVGPGMEPGTSGSVARNSDHETTEAVICKHIFFLICAVRLWVLRPLLAYCTSPG
jgi:hypothetical protein